MGAQGSRHFDKIDGEIAEIDADVAKLLERKRDLVRMRSRIWADRCLRSGDRVTPKNAKKFEVLGGVYYVLLTLESPRSAKGLRTHDLFSRVGQEDMNYDTFRSYLNRFKKEERLIYDELNGYWNLPPAAGAEPKSN